MPIRIKPIHDLGQCQLDMSNIKGICELIAKEFKGSSFRAMDGAWEIYDEPIASFLDAISTREKLDAFSIVGMFYPKSLEHETRTPELSGVAKKGVPFNPDSGREIAQIRTVKLSFNESEATISCDISPDEISWLEHFMFDLKKHIQSPTLLQRFGGLPIPLVLVGVAVVVPIRQPYCRIVIDCKPSNPRAISIKDNIAANFLYDGLKILLGAALALLSTWILSRFGVDVLQFFRPSGSAG